MATQSVPQWKIEQRRDRMLLLALLVTLLLVAIVRRDQRALFVPDGPGFPVAAFAALAGPQGGGFYPIGYGNARPRRPVAYMAVPAKSATGGGGVPQALGGVGGPLEPDEVAASDAAEPVLPASESVVQGPGVSYLGGNGGLPPATSAANNPGIGVGGVPEPASWATMILGIGMIGFVLRRNRAIAALGPAHA